MDKDLGRHKDHRPKQSAGGVEGLAGKLGRIEYHIYRHDA